MTGRIDTALDRTIVGGYTSLGYRFRRRTWDDELPRMDGKVVLVTGATSGIGRAAATGFERLGARVIVLARSADEQAGGIRCDLSELDSVRAAARRIAAREARLDVLVNNAGVLPDQRTLTSDGVELTFATNVRGPFLLTRLLTDLLEASAPARVINVSSGGMYAQRLRVAELQSEGEEFDGARAYARTKRAEVVLTELQAERLAGTGVVVHAMHPGWVDTPGVETSLPRFHRIMGPLLRDPEQGADTIVWLGAAVEPGRCSGLFWHDRRPRPTHYLSRTREEPAERERLWSECERLAG
jgi:NAD(P)-dependent dehydrogenase (short-subunit alcohol dehydrogenase family)